MKKSTILLVATASVLMLAGCAKTVSAEEAKALFVKATKSLDMAAQKGVVHQNMAARKKSRLAAKLNAMA